MFYDGCRTITYLFSHLFHRFSFLQGGRGRNDTSVDQKINYKIELKASTYLSNDTSHFLQRQIGKKELNTRIHQDLVVSDH